MVLVKPRIDNYNNQIILNKETEWHGNSVTFHQEKEKIAPLLKYKKHIYFDTYNSSVICHYDEDSYTEQLDEKFPSKEKLDKNYNNVNLYFKTTHTSPSQGYIDNNEIILYGKSFGILKSAISALSTYNRQIASQNA